MQVSLLFFLLCFFCLRRIFSRFLCRCLLFVVFRHISLRRQRFGGPFRFALPGSPDCKGSNKQNDRSDQDPSQQFFVISAAYIIILPADIVDLSVLLIYLRLRSLRRNIFLFFLFPLQDPASLFSGRLSSTDLIIIIHQCISELGRSTVSARRLRIAGFTYDLV